MVLWLVGAELELVVAEVAEVADRSREVLGVLAVAGVLGRKKLALDRNNSGLGWSIYLDVCSLGPVNIFHPFF